MTTTSDVDSPLELARQRFRDELVEAGLLVPMGIDGLYGRGGAFEQIVDGIDHVVRRKGAQVHGDGATGLTAGRLDRHPSELRVDGDA